MRFWDASAIVPLLVEQASSRHARAEAGHDPRIIAWWGTRIECLSALTRLEREERMDVAGMGAAVERLALIAEAWHEVLPGSRLRQIAERLLRVHPLRAADALQLAAALVAAGDDPTSLPFVSLDRHLNAAAAREGLTVVVPG
jgi:predicted nucleic acid-binding protein